VGCMREFAGDEEKRREVGGGGREPQSCCEPAREERGPGRREFKRSRQGDASGQDEKTSNRRNPCRAGYNKKKLFLQQSEGARGGHGDNLCLVVEGKPENEEIHKVLCKRKGAVHRPKGQDSPDVHQPLAVDECLSFRYAAHLEGPVKRIQMTQKDSKHPSNRVPDHAGVPVLLSDEAEER
jgi:hypothetical protein